MKLPYKIYEPEWSPSDGIIWYYSQKNWFDLDNGAKKFKIPQWLNELIKTEKQFSRAEGVNETKKKVRDLITQITNI